LNHLKKIVFILACLLSFSSFGQEQLTRILFILDASNSMNANWGGGQTRIEAAKELMIKTVDSLKGSINLEIALRVYGHQSPITATFQDCQDTKLEVPFAPNNYDAVKSRIRSILAKGTTPIARSLEAAASDFPDMNSRNIIILITDGIEACDNDPCVIAKKLKDKNINVTPFVIGLGLDLSYLEQFKCIGNYSEAETKETFKNVFKSIVSKVLINTTTQINLNDISKNAKETDVTLFLYEAGTKKIKYTFTHTINRFNNPDTLIIDPALKYDMVVNTIPPVEVKNISLQKNTHNTIVADVPQGYIRTRLVNGTRNAIIQTRVMQAGKEVTLNVQAINSTDKYLVGKYDLEILTLPRIYKTIEVTQGGFTNIDILASGTFSYKVSRLITGQIFIKNNEGSWEWVCNIDPMSYSGTWELQPNTYKIVYRQKDLKSTNYTTEKEFTIFSNKTTTLNL
jgi:Ca-activated chloride channel family protein